MNSRVEFTSVGNFSNSSIPHLFDNYILNSPQLWPITAAAYVVNFVLGLPINGYVLWLIVTGTVETITSDFFSLNQAISEIVYYLSGIFFFILRYHINIHLIRAAYFFAGFINAARPLFQCCICLERYVAVVHPVVFLKYKALRYKVFCCTVVWLVTLGSCFVYALADDYVISITNMYVTLGFYLVIFLVMLFFCLSVLRALKKPGPGEGSSQREEGYNVKRRAFKIIAITTVITVIGYLPFVISVLFIAYLSIYRIICAFIISALIAVITGLLKPIFYIYRAGKLPCSVRI